MKPIHILTSIALLAQGITAVAVPDISLSTRDDGAVYERSSSSWLSTAEELWKRKGGGAGGKKVFELIDVRLRAPYR